MPPSKGFIGWQEGRRSTRREGSWREESWTMPPFRGFMGWQEGRRSTSREESTIINRLELLVMLYKKITLIVTDVDLMYLQTLFGISFENYHLICESSTFDFSL